MDESTITVSGVTFTAKQVKHAVVTIDNRDITIHDKKDDNPVGFTAPSKEE